MTTVQTDGTVEVYFTQQRLTTKSSTF